ncbi:alpha/beta hydrolase [Actinospica robiniae]|uniref:alpha/beta hydrolase n=1 Tax=Actinospica robiniae TaxID=304901 RepID=UPI000427EE27|nr:alpha/beta hydrolase [Actinospica robiniae]
MSSEQRARLDAQMRHPRPEQEQPPIEEVRADFRELMARMALPDGFRTTPATLGGRPTLRVEPEAGARPGTILYLHGGSWIAGSPETALCLTANLVVRTGFTAYSVDYRLAPEHPFPAAIDDTVAAYRELLERGEDPSAIVFAGDSAGGGLCVTASLAARDAGLPLPAGILTFSAGLDATRTGESMRTKEGIDPIFSRKDFQETSPMYLAGADPSQPLLSPAVHADLTGFPPLLLQVGGNEILLDDSTRLAVRAREAGVDVTLDVTAGVPHGFQVFTGVLDEANEALDRAALFLTQRARSRR